MSAFPNAASTPRARGAYGTLTITQDISKYAKAKVLQKGAKTEAFLHFSTVAGERGAADVERDVRGFALRFYTEEGNWDMVGNNTPIFFVRDALSFQTSSTISSPSQLAPAPPVSARSP